MADPLTDAEISAALEICAAEPVHIPGIVQPFGCLLSVATDTNRIDYVSENCEAFLGQTAQSLLGQDARDVLGREPWHELRNAISRVTIDKECISAGTHMIGAQLCAVRVHKSGTQYVIEVEPAQDIGLDGPEAMKTLSFMMTQIQNCESQDKLFRNTVDMLQHLANYERVLIYRFDADWNGEVLVEAQQGPLEPLNGLRFPHWDIPKQAREIMSRIPIRFICDVDQTTVPLLAAPDMPPLDITLAELRGVSQVHMEYLRNMGVASTMTLSVMLKGKLWGVISLHHSRPKVPAPDLRHVLNSFLMLFSGKLEALQNKAALDSVRALDSGFAGETDGTAFDKTLPRAVPVVMDVLQAQGFATVKGEDLVEFGTIPGRALVMELAQIAAASGEAVFFDGLAERFPAHQAELNGVAGALVVGLQPDRAICIFRNEVEREVAWAGSPEKKIDTVGGRLRLSPRGSFATFLEQVKGRSDPWTDQDIYLASHLVILMHAAERQAVMENMNRQQALMIGELNHRVRNILALVRSVSRQARRRYASLDSYANAIENRIRALATTHDISGGRSTSPVALHDLLHLEFEPFGNTSQIQASITGPDSYLLPEVAPIFSLVLHELTTNAAKYGALSVAEGQVKVTLSEDDENFHVHWRESGGPTVVESNDRGFGMALITSAVPHELGGSAKVDFAKDGLVAEFTLPLHHFSIDAPAERAVLTKPETPEEMLPLAGTIKAGAVLILEDNYLIAKEMADQLADLGCTDVRTCATKEAALEIVENVTLSLAILDVNLGKSKTSEDVALALLQRDVPFMFVTGYGEGNVLGPELDQAPRLVKPISTTEFTATAARLVNPQGRDPGD